MKSSPILDTTLRWLVVLMGLVSFFLLLRGHDEPGGGFAAGLLASNSVIIVTIAYGTHAARKLLIFHPLSYIAVGLITALSAGLFKLESAYLSSLWITIPLGYTSIKLGTPLLFDLGVYMVVFGVISAFVLEIESVVNRSKRDHQKEDL